MSNDKINSDVEFIHALARLLEETDLAEIEVSREYAEDDHLHVRLSRHGAEMPVAHFSQPAASVVSASAAPAAAPVAATPAEPVSDDDPASHPGCVTSPMVGTVYLSPEPGANAFVQEGDQVEAGQTLLIVEAMKTMNPIIAPKAGKVGKVLVTNAEPVEFGAALLIIE